MSALRMASAAKATALLARNPALFCRVALSKLSTARKMPALPVRKLMNDIVFEYDLQGYRGTAPMYFGSYAPLIVEAMKRFLPRGGTFIDVGANIGYLSAVAAGLVGPTGEVHCFEPVPAYFERLERLARLNPNHKIKVNACAAGENPGKSTIYVTEEAGQSTMVPGYKHTAEICTTCEIPVVRLDQYIEDHEFRGLDLIKIDAEGFELPILKGLERFFQSTPHRPAIICEIAPRAYSLLGRNISQLAEFMSAHGYAARDLVDLHSRIDLSALHHVDDVLFLAQTRV